MNEEIKKLPLPYQGWNYEYVSTYFRKNNFNRLAEYVKKVKKKKFHNIFNKRVVMSSEETNVDYKGSKRWSTDPNKSPFIKKAAYMDDLTQFLKHIAVKYHSGWEYKHLVILMSEGGCSQQIEHCDSSATSVSTLCSVVIAVQNDTKIVINNRVIDIPYGQSVVFHGLISHAGAAYGKENRRLHCYIIAKNKEVPEEITIDWNVCDCGKFF